MKKPESEEDLIAMGDALIQQWKKAAAARGCKPMIIKGKPVRYLDQDLLDSFRERARARGEDVFVVLVLNDDEEDTESFDQWEIVDPENAAFPSFEEADEYVESVWGGDEEVMEARDIVVIYDARTDKWYEYEFTKGAKCPKWQPVERSSEKKD